MTEWSGAESIQGRSGGGGEARASLEFQRNFVVRGVADGTEEGITWRGALGSSEICFRKQILLETF